MFKKKENSQKKSDYNSAGIHESAENEHNSQRINPPSIQLKSTNENAELESNAKESSSLYGGQEYGEENGLRRTGLPFQLKSNIESLSRISMDDVKVNYNSSKPSQLKAHALAQGSNIELSSGQEHQLPHEAWHVVQQKQGRVEPTDKTKSGININDDADLEQEADTMGNKAVQMKMDISPNKVQKPLGQSSNNPIQRKINFNDDISSKKIKNAHISSGGSQGVLFIDDGGKPALVVKPEAGNAKQAIAAAEFTNAMIGDQNENGWSVRAPQARLATRAEITHLINSLGGPKGAKKTGDPAKMQTMINTLTNNQGEIVVYENAGGQDFLDYLATGAANGSTGKKQTKKGNQVRKGSGLEQMMDPGYCIQLGRAAAVDIFLGNDDRLHGKGNFENWRADSKNKNIRLVDNIIGDNNNIWKSRPDVIALQQGDFSAIADRISTEIVDLMKGNFYAAGRARGLDHTMIDQMSTTVLQPNLIVGLTSGKTLIMERAKKYSNSMKNDRGISKDAKSSKLIDDRYYFMLMGEFMDDFQL